MPSIDGEGLKYFDISTNNAYVSVPNEALKQSWSELSTSHLHSDCLAYVKANTNIPIPEANYDGQSIYFGLGIGEGAGSVQYFHPLGEQAGDGYMGLLTGVNNYQEYMWHNGVWDKTMLAINQGNSYITEIVTSPMDSEWTNFLNTFLEFYLYGTEDPQGFHWEPLSIPPVSDGANIFVKKFIEGTDILANRLAYYEDSLKTWHLTGE